MSLRSESHTAQCQRYELAVVGGGILGLAHAWMGLQRGLRVLVLERSPAAQGASVRNFGMIWPIGQPAGELHSLAMESRDYWRQLASLDVVSVEECGSLHLAHRRDEMAILEEFAAQQTHDVQVLNTSEVLGRTRLANPSGLLGGMWSPTELRVNPRTACARIGEWLDENANVDVQFSTSVTHIAENSIRASNGRRWAADRIIVCSGSDLRTLYPEILRTSGLRLCKLQMLRTAQQREPRSSLPHLASGLTLRHYSAFNRCPSLQLLRDRVSAESPDLDRYGIHVMASTCADGSVILGDSHEYDSDITPFDKSEIDELMLQELRKVFRLSVWNIRERWHGIYSKHPDVPAFEAVTPDGVRIFTGTGGAGMTLAFGLAADAWRRWEGDCR